MLQFAEWWMRLAEYTPSFTVILRPSPGEDCQGSKVSHSISISFRAFTQPGDDPTLIEEEAA